MMRTLMSILLLMLFSTSLSAEESLGKVVSILGDVDITSISSGKKFTPRVGTLIGNDYKIRTGKRSYMEILLNDGTKIFVKEITVLNINSLKLVESDPPTRLKMLTGKLRITVKKTFRDRSLMLGTPTAIAGVRGTDFGAIATRNETKLVVFEGRVEVANAERNIIKSYVVNEREEVSIKKDQPPTEPKVVPQNILKKWFEYYDVDERNRIIIRREREGGIIDGILRKKEY